MMHLPTALVDAPNHLAKRYYCRYNSRGYYNCDSAWNRWGRWVLAGILIFLGILFVLIMLCIGQRRRRRNRLAYGTAPAPAPPMQSYPGNNYNNNNNMPVGGAAPPAGYAPYNNDPAYSPPAGPPPVNGYYGNAAPGTNTDYYAGNNAGMRSPEGAHVKA